MTVYYSVTGIPAAQTRSSSNQVRGEFTLIQTAFASVNVDVTGKGSIIGQTWIGTHDYTGGVLRAATPVGASDVATKGYADNLALSTVLPGQVLGLLVSTGTVASFSKNLDFGLNEGKAASVASAATIDIWSGNGGTMHITGTTNISGLAAAPQAGAWRKLIFDGVLQLVYGGNFIVQGGGVNYVTAPNDVVFVYADTTTRFYLFIQKNDGTPVALPLATAAEIKVGANATKPITPAATLAALGFSSYVQTADQTITLSGALTIAHGLGRTPILISGFLKNINVGELGYAIGEISPVSLGVIDIADGLGISVTADATNIYVRFSTAMAVINKATGAAVGITNLARWTFFLRALA